MSKMLAVTLTVPLLFAMLSTSPNGQETELENPTNCFLAKKTGVLHEYKALRHMEVKSLPSGKISSMDVETELINGNVFTYKVIKEENLGTFGRKAMRTFLDGEKKETLEGNLNKSAFNEDNYIFAQAEPDGETWKIIVSPKDKAAHLIKGFLLVKQNGELVQSEGNLIKNPSFWVRDVSLSVKYNHIFGIRVPISLNSVAKVRWSGKFSLLMEYRYISVNGFLVP